jgi:phosphatidylinositol alpha-1,6-mannosyltransferase
MPTPGAHSRLAPSGPSGALLVTELFPPLAGGSAVLLHETYARLAPELEVTVLTDARVSATGSLRAPSDGLAVEHAEIGCTEWGWLNARGRRHSRQLARRLRALSGAGDVVHCARPLPEGAAACLARLRGGRPYAVWTHGEDLGMALTSRELTLIVRLVYRCSAASFANSRNTARLLRTFSVPDDRIHVVYPGVDASRFHPEVDGSLVRAGLAGPDEVLVLSVGRLQQRKGHDVAIEAIGRLARAGRPIRYVIIGTGEEQGRLQEITRGVGVERLVTFAGEVSADRLPAYYAASDIFLLPNREVGHDFEGFGIVFLEAAASGKPSIGGASGGVPEAVEDGRTGLLVDGRDADSVAAAIARLAEAPQLRRQLGEAGRRRVVEHFTWARAAATVREVHDQIRQNLRPTGSRLPWSMAATTPRRAEPVPGERP